MYQKNKIELCNINKVKPSDIVVAHKTQYKDN